MDKNRNDGAPGAAAHVLREALEPFASKYRPEYELRADPQMQAFVDANTVTPGVTMGDFRRAHLAAKAFDQLLGEPADLDLTPESISLSKESGELVNEALALIFAHGPVHAMKWLAARMEQQAVARL